VCDGFDLVIWYPYNAARVNFTGPGSAATAAGSDALSANPPKAPAAASGTGTPGIRITDMTSKTPSHTVQTQVQHLNGMLYVWVGGSGSMDGGLAPPSQPNMLVAHPPRTYAGTASSTSAASVLFGAETLPAAAEGTARKLATWAGEPLFLTWALPLSAADEQAGAADDVVLVVKKAIQQGRQV